MLCSLTRSQQSQSRLLQLPLELRLKILRFLLRDAEIFGNVTKLKNDDRGENNCHMDLKKINLSAQLMRTCQQMHEDATEVLYGENVLSVNVHGFNGIYGPGLQQVEISTFACCIKAESHDSLPSSCVEARSMVDNRCWSLRPDNDGDCKEKRSRTSLSDCLSILERMRRIQAKITYTFPLDVYFCCRILRSIFEQGHLTLQLEYKPTFFDFDVLEEQPEIETILRSCVHLRCRSLEFIGLPDTFAGSATANSVKTIVEGTELHDDLHDQWNQFKHQVMRESLIRVDDDGCGMFCICNDEFRALSSSLDTALATLDTENFERYMNEIKSYVEGLIQELTNGYFNSLTRIIKRTPMRR